VARDIPWLRTEATQARLRQMASVLGMVPVDGGKMWLSGAARDGWWLSGCVGGDCKLPMTKGARTAREAFEHAWGWLAPELEQAE
jgi:hypothetical protein